jgi:O-antigen/teichoic acid export membrane protein
VKKIPTVLTLHLSALLRKFIGFSVVPAFSLLAPLMIIPVIARNSGPAAWSSISVSLVIGQYCATFGSFGWNVSGGAKVAICCEPTGQRDIYCLSFWSRTLASILCSTIGVLLCWNMASPGSRIASSLMCAATGLNAFSLSWFAVGCQSPKIVVTYEAIPKALASLISLFMIVITGVVYLYPLGLIIGTLIGLILFHVREFQQLMPPLMGAGIIADSMRCNIRVALVDIVAAIYVMLPLPVASLVLDSQETSGLASACQLYRWGLVVIVVFAGTMQGWVLSYGANNYISRSLASLLGHLLIGSIGFFVLVFTGEVLTSLFFGQELSAEARVLFWFGTAYFAVSMSTPFLRNFLIPKGEDSWVLVSVLTSAAVGLVAIPIFGALWGGQGIAAGYAASEGVVLILVSFRVFRSIGNRQERIASFVSRFNGGLYKKSDSRC